MKALCITLLLVLSLQLRLTHNQDGDDQPLSGIAAFIRDPNDDSVKLARVYFTDEVHFNACGTNWAKFTASEDGAFQITSDWSNSGETCESDRDGEITALFSSSTTYQIVRDDDNGPQITLFNANGEQTLHLVWEDLDEDKEVSSTIA